MLKKNNLYNTTKFHRGTKSKNKENAYKRVKISDVSFLRKSGLLLVLALLLNIIVWKGERMLLQRGIADEVLRFHVLANSDSEADQAVKLEVRDAVLAWLSDSESVKGSEQNENESEFSLENEITQRETAEIIALKTAKTSGKKTENRTQKETEEAFLRAHLSDLETVANEVLASEYLPYRAHVSLATCYFPSRTYGACTFPPGWYETLRIELGKAKGHNWWCVLYPRLCFTDSLHAVVEEEEMQQLSDVLTEAEYDSLLHEPSKWKLTFRWF